MPTVIFNSFKRDIQNGSINLLSDTIRVMLCTNSYVPDQDTHTKRSDVTNEVSGTGYTAGGAALASKTVTADNINNRGVFDAADLVWTAATITNARYAVLYKARGGAATADELITAIDFGSDRTSTNGDFTITWDASGILLLA